MVGEAKLLRNFQVMSGRNGKFKSRMGEIVDPLSPTLKICPGKGLVLIKEGTKS